MAEKKTIFLLLHIEQDGPSEGFVDVTAVRRT